MRADVDTVMNWRDRTRTMLLLGCSCLNKGGVYFLYDRYYVLVWCFVARPLDFIIICDAVFLEGEKIPSSANDDDLFAKRAPGGKNPKIQLNWLGSRLF